MKLCLPKDLKVGDRVQAQGHAACGLDPCINEVGVCMRCLWKVKESCDAAVRRTRLQVFTAHGYAVAAAAAATEADLCSTPSSRDGVERIFVFPEGRAPSGASVHTAAATVPHDADGLCLGGLRPLRCAHAP